MNLLKKAEEHTSKMRLPAKAYLIAGTAIMGVVVVIIVATVVVQRTYRDRILPGVQYANINLGGLDRLAATETIQKAIDDMLNKGLTVRVNGETEKIALRIDSADVSYTLIDADINTGVELALQVGKEGFGQVYGLALALGGRKTIAPILLPNNELLAADIIAAFPEVENPGQPTRFAITTQGATNSITIVPGTEGNVLDVAAAFNPLMWDLQDLNLNVLDVGVTHTSPDVSVDEAMSLIDEAESALAMAPYTLTYTPDNQTGIKTWEVTKDTIAAWLIPANNADGQAVVTLESAAMTDFLAMLHTEIDIAAQDARFSVEGSRVVEFAGSHDGVTVNDTALIASISAYFQSNEGGPILVPVDRVEPTVTTGNVNNLGIGEVLGVGTSSFKGSPSNRIKNITHGADKLNGLLFAPGETVSLVEKLGPFTVADGYLPELVIKGDEIIPEVGGGLCQIGTTTFRAVMNSGLKVTERRNHSLVVSYYNDPSNGQPGTDATIYDPSPDFKFTNDTTNYILLTTDVNTEDQSLLFTFWGTNDGRRGSYTPPEVLSWTGYGSKVIKETDTLAPGVEKCQAAHPGATTNFTYTVTYGDGTEHKEDFFSSYRSLPQICLVGRAAPVETPETPPAESPAISSEESIVE